MANNGVSLPLFFPSCGSYRDIIDNGEQAMYEAQNPSNR